MNRSPKVIQITLNSYRRFLVAWVDTVGRCAWRVVLASVLFSVAVAAFVAENVTINTDTTDMLSPDLPFRRNARALKAAFPQFSDNILVVIDGETPDLIDDAAAVLAVRLGREPDLFGAIYDPAGDPFFRRNGLLFLDTDALADLGDRLAEAQPFLGALWRDPSLRGLFSMLELAIDETLSGDGDVPIDIAAVLDEIARVVEAQAAGRFRHLSWRGLMMGDAKADAPARRYLLIQPVLDFQSLQPASAAIDALRRIVDEMELDEDHGVRVRLTGSAALAQDELKSVEEGMGLAAAVSLVLVIGLLMAGLRSIRLVAATLVTLAMGLIWTAGFAIAALGQLNLISVAFAVLFIGLSVDFGIHFVLRYEERVASGSDHPAAMHEAAHGVGGALTLCAVAAAIAFYSFLPTDYLGLAELGLIAGTGMFIALFANLTILPALLTLAPLPAWEKKTADKRAVNIALYARDHARTIVWSALVIGVAALAVAPWSRFDFDPLSLKDPSRESVTALLDVMQDPDANPYALVVLAPSLAHAGELARRLDAQDEVARTATLADYVPGGQEEKLDIIATIALYLTPAFAAAEPDEPPTLAGRRAVLASLAGKLARLGGRTGDTAAAAARLDAALARLSRSGAITGAALEELETRLLAGLPGRLAELREALEAEPVTLEDLPRSVVERNLAADGQARLEVFPAGDPGDRAAMMKFVEAVRKVAPGATGLPVVIIEAGQAVVTAFLNAAALAMASIALLLVALLGNKRQVVLVFAPLILAAVLTIAVSVLLDLPFNFANVIVLPLLFGLGVAGGIHLVVREHSGDSAAGVLATSTPRAVVFSALTTIGSFGSLALSSHPGTSSMGILLTVAIVMTLICTLVVLPALMAVTRPRDARTG